jgi:hypothetical protein
VKQTILSKKLINCWPISESQHCRHIWRRISVGNRWAGIWSGYKNIIIHKKINTKQTFSLFGIVLIKLLRSLTRIRPGRLPKTNSDYWLYIAWRIKKRERFKGQRQPSTVRALSSATGVLRRFRRLRRKFQIELLVPSLHREKRQRSLEYIDYIFSTWCVFPCQL